MSLSKSFKIGDLVRRNGNANYTYQVTIISKRHPGQMFVRRTDSRSEEGTSGRRVRMDDYELVRGE